MTDHFALLDEPRRPWLEVEALKAKFHALSAAAHPDRVHAGSDAEKHAATERYTGLNAAYHCLREPKDRLQHLLALELGGKPVGIERVPADTMELFMQAGQLCREVDGFLVERSKVTAPLLKVQLFERGMEWSDKLQAVLQTLRARRDELEAELPAMNAAWEAAPPPGDANRAASLPLDRLEQIYRTLSYLARWSGQLHERMVQLSL